MTHEEFTALMRVYGLVDIKVVVEDKLLVRFTIVRPELYVTNLLPGVTYTGQVVFDLRDWGGMLAALTSQGVPFEQFPEAIFEEVITYAINWNRRGPIAV